MGATSAIRFASFTNKVARGLDGFTVRRREDVELQSCGVPELDALLGGGFPRGALVEICGSASSGRTSLSLALLAQATRRQEACAFVDVSDALDPLSVAAAGVDTKRLLWVRCGNGGTNESKDVTDGKIGANAANAEADRVENRSESFPCKSGLASDLKNGAKPGFPMQEKPHGFAWTHPRDAMRGVETSIPGLMRRLPKAPSYEEMSFAVRCAGEQVEPDRQEPRRGENVRRKFLPHSQIAHAQTKKDKSFLQTREWSNSNAELAANSFGWARMNSKPWKRLEQALKTTDLLLHSGGWGAVVVDLAGISWVEARRIPIHTWFRFRRVVENSPTILLLLGEASCAKSCASLVLQCRRVGEMWSAIRAHENDETAALGDEEAASGASRLRVNEWRAVSQKNLSIKLGIATLQGFAVQGEIASSRMQRLETATARWQTRTF